MSVPKSRRNESRFEVFEKSKELFYYTYERVQLFESKDQFYFSKPLFNCTKDIYFEIKATYYDKDKTTHFRKALILCDQLLELLELAYSSKIKKLPSSVIKEWTTQVITLKNYLK